ncbi:ABC transporter permease [Xylocopilactobacillus apicola]|uniref:Sodium ABC transporter permease n=1 Tax=Xylocopilactobacillus apicola TaxID=2932184 RepID=A0AAU9DE40_9LACO|nr:ABC transporter permease [Xylocopilactobacillus apicola]BDR58110.1 sodium ABC transporter permease [Xylocopilactobacillus apicola]
MSKLKVVLKNVLIQNLKSPIFIFMLFFPIIIGAVGTIIGRSNSGSAKIAVISSDKALAKTFSNFNSDDTKYLTKYDDQKTAKKALIDQDIDGYLVLKESKGEIAATLYKTNQSSKIYEQDIELAVNQIGLNVKAQQMNLPPATLKKIVEPTEFKQHTSMVSNHKLVTQDQSKMITKMLAVMAVTFIFFFLLIIYMTQMATNIGREKGERVMEIILSSTSAKTQFLGEVGGVFLTMVVQVLIYLAMILGFVKYFQVTKSFDGFLRNLNWGLLFSPEMIYTLIFGIMGVFLYLVVAAMLGALVSNIEQVNQSIIPLMVPAMIAYILVFASIGGGMNGLVKVCAFIPFISQTLMPSLLVLGKVTWLEALTSMLIYLVVTILMSFISIKLYRSNVLVYSQKGVWDSFKSSLSLRKKAKMG